MAEDLLSLELTEGARFTYTTLRSDDRRLADAWFDHLRNWRRDEFIRSRSRRLKSDEEIYVFQTSTDLLIAFQIEGNKVIVLSIFHKEALRAFEAMAEQAAP